MTSRYTEHHFERNIVEIKKEYTEYLISIISPFIYEGFQQLYKTSLDTEKQLIEDAKNLPNITNPGPLIIFQNFIKKIPDLNDEKITKETNRIRDNSGCSDIFDDLIKATIKSNIVLLTYSASGKECKLVNEKFHQTIDPKTFVHKCYIECARIFYDHPELFWHEFKSNDIKHNQRVIYQLIRNGIVKAIRNTLPMKSILEEYLNKDYIDVEEDIQEKYKSLRDIIKRDLGKKEDLGGTNRIFESTPESMYMDNEENKNETNLNNFNDLILGGNDETFEHSVNVASNKEENIVENVNINNNEFNNVNVNVNKNEIVGENVNVDKNENIKENEHVDNAQTSLPKNSFREDYEVSNNEALVEKLFMNQKGKRYKKVPEDNILYEAINGIGNKEEENIQLTKQPIETRNQQKQLVSTKQSDGQYFSSMLR